MMNATKWGFERYREVRSLLSMLVWFENRHEIRRHQQIGRTIPPLQIRGGFELHHRPEDVALFQVAEILGVKCYRQHIREPRSGTVVDIGANIGVATLDWATRLSGARIHAYEPNPETYAVLATNVAKNHAAERVVTYQEAVGHHREDGILLRGSARSVLTSRYTNAAGMEEFHVRVVSLDEVIERCAGDSIHLVKIDTEGAEADILEGASALTLKHIQQVVLEYHDSLVPDALARCRKVLIGAGFDCVACPGPFQDQGLLYAHRIGAEPA